MAQDAFGLIGTSIDNKYRVDEVVGEGGFGLVYRGFHLSFEHPIALKCLKVPTHFTAEAQRLFLEKFREEGKLLSRLSDHGSIVRVFDFGVTACGQGQQVPYLVLEWLRGEDLEHHLQSLTRPMSERQALSLMRPAVDAIAMAHSMGIAHRDLKPANLFLAETARGTTLKVLDFGIAKAMQEGEHLTACTTRTSSGFNAFSPQYGAPEQFRRKLGPTGPWTDVYALGLVLVELVTRKPAREGDELADFYEAALKGELPTPEALGTRVHSGFEKLCARALARSPQERFQDAGALLQAMEELIPVFSPEKIQVSSVEPGIPTAATLLAGSADGLLSVSAQSSPGDTKIPETVAAGPADAVLEKRSPGATEVAHTAFMEGPPSEVLRPPPAESPGEPQKRRKPKREKKAQEEQPPAHIPPAPERSTRKSWSMGSVIGVMIVGTAMFCALVYLFASSGKKDEPGSSEDKDKTAASEPPTAPAPLAALPRPGAIPVQMYVMSMCPYAAQAFPNMKAAIDKLGRDVAFQMDYIGQGDAYSLTSPHGADEVQADLAQVCARSVAPAGWLNMVACQFRNFKQAHIWQACATEADVPVSKVNVCLRTPEGKKLLAESFARTGERGINGSPTIYIAGKRYPDFGPRTTADFVRAICEEFEGTKPAACAQ